MSSFLTKFDVKPCALGPAFEAVDARSLTPFGIGAFFVCCHVIPLIVGVDTDAAKGYFLDVKMFDNDVTVKGRPLAMISIIQSSLRTFSYSLMSFASKYSDLSTRIVVWVFLSR